MVDYKSVSDYKPAHEEEEYTMDENPFSPPKTDNELFKDEDYVPQQLIRVKRYNKKDGELWKIFVDGEVSVVIPATRLNNKEKDFFRTTQGFLYLIEGYKKGWRGVISFKKGLR